MASFEAEMKRQMAAESQEASPCQMASPARTNVTADAPPLDDQNPVFGNAFGRWKRASTPADGSSDDADSSIRGASAPDGDGAFAEIKTERDDGKI